MEQSSEQSADRSMDQDEGHWLTYPELAAVRGIDKPSAIRLATRKKWRRQRDNHRVVRVLVPPDWASPRYQSMDQPMDKAMDRSDDQGALGAALAAVEAAHQGEVAALHGQIAGLKAAADATAARLTDAEARADRAEAAITGERKRADRAEYRADGLRSRVDELEVNLGAARAEAHQATETAAALTRDEVARKARGRWARLRAAWGGSRWSGSSAS
jgi:hypothetical protein